MDTNKSRLHWLDNLRWFTVILVLVYHVFYLFNNKGVLGGIGGFVDDPKGQPQDVITYILYPWFMMLAMLGCFKSWFDSTSPFATYMSRSSFGIYVVHYLVIVSLGYMMKVYTTLSPFAMYIILLVAVLTLSPLLYEILRRIPFIRWCVLGVNKK